MPNRFRRGVLLSVLTLWGCHLSETTQPAFPKSVSPGWRLSEVARADVASAPEPVRAARPKAYWKATYLGPGVAHAHIWALSGPSGLDLVQKWRPEANTVVFYTDRYFAAM